MEYKQIKFPRYKKIRAYANLPHAPEYKPDVISKPHYARKKTILNYTIIIIIINIAFFLIAISLLPFLGEERFLDFFIKNIALSPVHFVQHPWTLLTSMFMHAPGAPFALFSTHLFVNMISLLFLGSFIERIIGSKRFLKLYFAGGLGGGLMLLLLFSISNSPKIISLSFFTNPAVKTVADISAVGASAAIFSLASCLAILVPRIPVLVFFILPMKLWQAVVFLMIILSVVPGVANSAHLGGFLVGAIYALYLKKKHRKKVMLLNRMLGLR